MDANDLFKKLTTNLSFSQRSLPPALKRKASVKNEKKQQNGAGEVDDEVDHHEVLKQPKLDTEVVSKRPKKAKKKNLFQISREKVKSTKTKFAFLHIYAGPINCVGQSYSQYHAHKRKRR